MLYLLQYYTLIKSNDTNSLFTRIRGKHILPSFMTIRIIFKLRKQLKSEKNKKKMKDFRRSTTLTLFQNYGCLLVFSEKMRGYLYFSFWIPITLANIYFIPIVITFAKIHLYQEAPSLTPLNIIYCPLESFNISQQFADTHLKSAEIEQNLKKFTEGNARKFTVNFAIFGYADVIKIRKKLQFYVSARRLLQLASSTRARS